MWSLSNDLHRGESDCLHLRSGSGNTCILSDLRDPALGFTPGACVSVPEPKMARYVFTLARVPR